MSAFPQFGIINDNIIKTIESRKDNNVANSQLVSWIRVSSAAKSRDDKHNGIILESNLVNSSFENEYGGQGKSGRVGLDFNKTSVYAEDDRSHRPSPTIDSLSIENGQEGLSRKAKFTIKCYTLKQAEILSAYFLEPGFVVLIEFGWNTQNSFNNRADLMSGKGPCEIAKYNSYNHIISKRTNSNGEYDGFMGKITNGGYSSAEGETYEISVEVTTLGEIPAYLQIHKNGTNNDSKKYVSTGLTYNVSTIESTAKSDDKYGLSLFQRMYNRLPSEQRTIYVKSLSTGKDVNGTPWTNPANYINMDPDRREELDDDLTKVKARIRVDGSPKKLNLAEGTEIFTDQSYIRCELAFAILNAYSKNVIPQDSECSGVKTYNYTINTIDTMVRAHPHMFSTDSSKLYIPNTKLPSFYLKDVLTSTEKITDSKWSDVAELTKDTVNGCIFQTDQDKYAFPSTKEIEVPELSLVHPTKAAAEEWGYLRNLYINFEFFVETIQRSNMVAKDIYYELLNGISSAVNSYWMFELIESPNNPTTDPLPPEPVKFNLTSTTQPSWNLPKKPENTFTLNRPSGVSNRYLYEIAVKDLTFSGDIPIGLKDLIPTFYTNGIDSPFISFGLNMDLPAIKRNQILGQRASQFSTQTEGQVEPYTFFSSKLDPVSKILDSFKASPENSSTNINDDSAAASKDDALHINTDIINNKATVIPLKLATGTSIKYDEYSSSIKLEAYMLIGAWNDTSLLKSVEVFDGSGLPKPPLKWPDDNGNGGRKKSNPQILAIDFTFEIHGNSGIKIGDVFMIKDIPRPFKNGVFQVMNLSHQISGAVWTTSVSAKMRNIDFD